MLVHVSWGYLFIKGLNLGLFVGEPFDMDNLAPVLVIGIFNPPFVGCV
jgi:hypothetical protein